MIFARASPLLFRSCFPVAGLTPGASFANISRLREFLVSIKKSSTLDDFKLFYEELAFSSKPNRIRRLRVATSVK